MAADVSVQQMSGQRRRPLSENRTHTAARTCRPATCPPTASRTRTCSSSSSRGRSRPPGVLSRPPSLPPGLPWAPQRPDPLEGVEAPWDPRPLAWEPWDRHPPAQVSSTACVAAVLIRSWGGRGRGCWTRPAADGIAAPQVQVGGQHVLLPWQGSMHNSSLQASCSSALLRSFGCCDRLQMANTTKQCSTCWSADTCVPGHHVRRPVHDAKRSFGGPGAIWG